MPTPTPERLRELEARRTDLKACAESLLIERRAEGVTDLDEADSVRFRAMAGDIEALSETIELYRADLKRADLGKYEHLAGGSRRHGSAAAIAPLAFDPEQLRAAHGKLSRGESAILETRAGFTSASSLLPAQLYGLPTFPRHENRLVDRLPGVALDVPSLEYVQLSTVSGAAAIVGEGQPKPEVTIRQRH